MARLRYNGLSTTLGASLTNSATSVTFGAALTHSNGTAVPTISGSDYIPLVILDSNGHESEIVYLTAYTSGATTGTISRGQEGATGVAHSSGDKVICTTTVADVQGDTGWTNATLTNSWVTNGSPWPTPGYRKGADGRVYLRGVVKSGTVGAAIFTLPAGYRPAARVSFSPLNANAGAEVDVSADGTVVCSVGATSYVGLDGVAFFTD